MINNTMTNERTWCGEVNATQEGQPVLLKGWVHRVRDHGGILFMDLRDDSGLVQIVLPDQTGKAEFTSDADSGVTEAVLEKLKLREESVVSVRGTVAMRPEGTVNDRMATGSVEIVTDANSTEVLGPAEVQIGDDLFIGPVSMEERDGAMLFLNHSCDPNVGVNGHLVPLGEFLGVAYEAGDEAAVRPEGLDSVVGPIAHVHVAVGVNGHVGRAV